MRLGSSILHMQSTVACGVMHLLAINLDSSAESVFMQVLIQQRLQHVVQHATTTDGALEMYPGAGVANIGIMLFRSSAMIFAQVCNCPPDGTPDRSDMTDIQPLWAPVLGHLTLCGHQSYATLVVTDPARLSSLAHLHKVVGWRWRMFPPLPLPVLQ